MSPSDLNILVACEYSGIVRDSFTSSGCNAVQAHNIERSSLMPTHRDSGRFPPPRRFNILKVIFLFFFKVTPCNYLSFFVQSFFFGVKKKKKNFQKNLKKKSNITVNMLNRTYIAPACHCLNSIVSTKPNSPNNAFYFLLTPCASLTHFMRFFKKKQSFFYFSWAATAPPRRIPPPKCGCSFFFNAYQLSFYSGFASSFLQPTKLADTFFFQPQPQLR